MVLGMRGKNMRTSKVQIDYQIHIQEIKPWPPSQSLRSLNFVLMEMKNGSNTLGSTNLVSPSLGSVIGEGRIEFNESFKFQLNLKEDLSLRNGNDSHVFQKNFLEFNLYEARKDNKIIKGQLLGSSIVDLANYGIIKEGLGISIPMNCKRSYRNNDQPLLFIRIKPDEKTRVGSTSLKERFTNEVFENSSNDDGVGDSVSTLMNDEYAEEAEIASFTDDEGDVSSHSRSVTRSDDHENFEENFHEKVTHSRKKDEDVQTISSKSTKINPKDARNGSLEGKIDYLENKVKMLEGELREAASIEAALYSVVAEHGNSMSKVHTPARRLSRLYIHACRENVQGRRKSAAKSSVSGLVLVSKACGNDVPRLTFWLSNTIVLRTIISRNSKNQVSSNHVGSKWRRKSEGDGNAKVPSSQRWKGGRNESVASLGYECFGNWDDPHVFISALEKVEAWIFSQIVESIWWQTLTPHMQHVDINLANKEVDSSSRKSYRRISSSCDEDKGNMSLNIWKNAFKEACERLCPIRAGGHECGCLPMLPRMIMEQCVARLDVAMFNAIQREYDEEIPTDPISDPISDLKVLPIPPGKSSFGAGAHLKNVIGNWSRWLSDQFSMNEENSFEDKNDSNNIDNKPNTSFKSFTLLNALSDLLMLPKDMLLCASIRNEVCPMFSAPLIKKILDNFFPDEFCPDPVSTHVLEALKLENDIENGKELVNNFICNAAPIAYSPPPVTSIARYLGKIGSKSSVLRKSYTSDDELNELKSPFYSIFLGDSLSSATSMKLNLKSREICGESPIRYDLLRDVWMDRN